MFKRVCIAAGILLLSFWGIAGAEVLSGTIDKYPADKGNIRFGEGTNYILTHWICSTETSGMFFGSSFGDSLSNADIYVHKNLQDPSRISDAAAFSYTNATAIAQLGDTVFFRSKDGYYGAFVATAIDKNEEFDPLKKSYGTALAFLSGTWYFQTDKSADFTKK